MYEAVTITLFPAPEKITYLTVCNWKTFFLSLRCKRAKSDLSYTELCQCDDCQNDKKDEFVKVADQHIKEGYEYYTVTMKNTALKKFTMKLKVRKLKIDTDVTQHTVLNNIFITIYAPTILLISAFCHVKMLSFSIK